MFPRIALLAVFLAVLVLTGCSTTPATPTAVACTLPESVITPDFTIYFVREWVVIEGTIAVAVSVENLTAMAVEVDGTRVLVTAQSADGRFYDHAYQLREGQVTAMPIEIFSAMPENYTLSPRTRALFFFLCDGRVYINTNSQEIVPGQKL